MKKKRIRRMERWKQAQSSEKAFWEESFGKGEEAFCNMCMKLYQYYNNILSRNNIITNGKKLLDVGSGPFSLLSVFPGELKIALDPLMDYFKTKVPEQFYIDNNITPINASGERLQYDDKYIDLICCINTLDHADKPKELLKEVNRCLKDDGYFLLSLNHYAWPIVCYKKCIESIGFGDLNHPHTYHINTVKSLLADNGFKIIDFQERNTPEIVEKIRAAGGDIFISNTSVRDRISRAAKLNGWGHVIKQAIAAPGLLIVNKLFKTYPDSIILCRKERETSQCQKI